MKKLKLFSIIAAICFAIGLIDSFVQSAKVPDYISIRSINQLSLIGQVATGVFFIFIAYVFVVFMIQVIKWFKR